MNLRHTYPEADTFNSQPACLTHRWTLLRTWGFIIELLLQQITSTTNIIKQATLFWLTAFTGMGKKERWWASDSQTESLRQCPLLSWPCRCCGYNYTTPAHILHLTGSDLTHLFIDIHSYLSKILLSLFILHLHTVSVWLCSWYRTDHLLIHRWTWTWTWTCLANYHFQRHVSRVIFSN